MSKITYILTYKLKIFKIYLNNQNVTQELKKKQSKEKENCLYLQKEKKKKI